MAKYHKDSEECGLVNFDLLTPPKSCVDIKDVFYTEISTINAVTEGNTPVEFHIPPTPQYYVDLSHTLLYMKIQILKKDGSLLNEEQNRVGPVNGIAHTMLQQIDVHINDKLVTRTSIKYI
jgi:hypothetical protein